MCFDGVKRLCHIRGKLRKKVWTLSEATSTMTLSSMMLTLRAPVLTRATTSTEFSHFYLLSRPCDGFNLEE